MGDVENAPDETSAMLPKKTEKGGIEAPRVESREIANLRLWWGASYANAMGVCGIVLVALGSTLSSLAADCGTSATRVGTVFIARGAGAVTGALSSARLYSPPRPGNLVMVFVLLALAGVLLYMPFVKDVWVLHVTWFLLGMCTATLDTGCQIMTRKVHGVHAGPWLGANTVCFAIAGALVPLIELITGQLFAQYATLATIAVLNAAALYAAPAPETPAIRDQLPPRVVLAAKTASTSRHPKYSLELIFGATVFWLIGGKVDTTSYITTYVKTTGIISNHDASLSLLLLWVMITVGRLLGLHDQIALKKQTKRNVFVHLTAWLLTGTFGMLLCTLFPARSWAFWAGVSLYGLGNGPCVGYVYDLVNRMTVQSEMGMSIVMFGLNFGASLIPYLTTVVWDFSPLGPESLVWVTLLSMAIPMPLLLLSAVVGNVWEKDSPSLAVPATVAKTVI
mmetsp:Transcript_24302/g.75945  ORF Transcript_24302/g.75945 Transcript_24302/m.75945 type:complete len:451 (+) Transcript_24302:77-1429(+)